MNWRIYSDEDRQRFTAFVDDRAILRPAACHGGANCWVIEGPPAMCRRRGNGVLLCVGCSGPPVIPPALREHGGKRYLR